MPNRDDGLIEPYGRCLDLGGGTMSGPIAMGSNKITGLAVGSSPSDAARVDQANDLAQYYLDGAPTFLRKNITRAMAGGNLSALSAGVMTSTALFLYAGDVVTNLTFVSGGTAANTPTHWWFALYSTAVTPALDAQTADQTNTAWGANTAVTLALTAPYTVTTTGIHYASVMVAATTPPTLLGASGSAYTSAAVVSGQKILAQTSGSSLTTTAPATIATATTVGTIPLVIAT